MGVPSVSSFEVGVEGVEADAAVVIGEAIVKEEVKEDHGCVGPDAISGSAFVFGVAGVEWFVSGVSDYFFSGGVGLSLDIAIAIGVGACMPVSFIMVALGMEVEMSFSISELLVVLFEVGAVVNVAEIRTKFVAAASNDEVEDVAACQDADKPFHGHCPVHEQNYPCCHSSH